MALSKDLNIITAEIRSFQEQHNQAIFEIGKRLKFVKENDLAHGEYLPWLDSIGLNHRTACRFVKVYETFSENEVSGISVSKLYEIITLENPKDFIKATHVIDGKEKSAKELTVKEIRYLKRANLRRDSQNKKKEIMSASSKKCCAVCGFDYAPVLQMHHRHALEYGGTNELSNLILLCPTCHSLVHGILTDKVEKEFGDDYTEEWLSRNLTEGRKALIFSLALEIYGPKELEDAAI